MRKRLVAVLGSPRMWEYWVDTMVGGRACRLKSEYETEFTKYFHINPDKPHRLQGYLLDDFIQLAGYPIPEAVTQLARDRVIQGMRY